MQRRYKANVAKLPQAFSEMAAFAGAKVMAQTTLLLDRLGGATGKEWAVPDMQPSVQQRLQTAIMQWQLDWRLPKLDGGCLQREEVGIPREFEEVVVAPVKEVVKDEESEGEGGGEPMVVG
jgi:hypothetical protein